MFLPRRPGVAVRSLVIASCIGLAGIAAPASSLAGTDPMTGAEAVVANADGANVRIRDGASLDATPLTKVPEGTDLTIIEGPIADDDGTTWFRVDADGVIGYIAADFVATDDPAEMPEDVPGVPDGATGLALTTDQVNLRSGPSLAYTAIDKVPAGATLSLSGYDIDGWLRVSWKGTTGWIDGTFIDIDDDATPPTTEAPTPPGEEPPADETPAPDDTSTRYASQDVNLRTEPAFDSTIARVIPMGTRIELTGEEQNGFVKGTVDDVTGWFSEQFLSATPEGTPPDEVPETPDAPEPTETPAPTPTQTPAPETPTPETPTPETPEPEPSGSTIVWPMKGGEWRVLQGYNGSSHQDRGDLWQYQDSFDLVRSDGSTSGQPTYSPVNGTVRWLDPSTGGIAIDVGDGLAVSLFHIDIDGAISPGDRLTQGQFIGTVSPPGGGGNGGTPHIHLTAWATDDGGNWSRDSIPFEGRAAINGQEFPNNGSSLQWTGTIITP